MESEQDELEEKRTLEAKIDELTETLDRMEKEWYQFVSDVSRMAYSKLSDPRYPFTNWELQILQSPGDKALFRATMRALQNRLEGKETPLAEQVEIRAIPSLGDCPGRDAIAKEVLYAATKPSLAEVVHILKQIGRQDDEGLAEVMRAVKLEHEVDSEFGVLARFVLDGVRFAKETP